MEGLVGRIVGDVLIHYLNLAGAYIVCATVLAVALYLSTAFSFSSLQVWTPTRFAFVFALRDRWRIGARSMPSAGCRRNWTKRRAIQAGRDCAADSGTDANACARRAAGGTPAGQPARCRRYGCTSNRDRTHVGSADEEPKSGAVQRADGVPGRCCCFTLRRAGVIVPEVSERADSAPQAQDHAATHRRQLQIAPQQPAAPAGRATVGDAEELKLLAQVLTEKYAEFDVHGQVTQINPGPVVTTFEFKPEAGIKYSRITSLSDDLCLALKAESILIERMAGKSTVGIQVPNHKRETIWLREEHRGDGIPRLKVEAHAWRWAKTSTGAS